MIDWLVAPANPDAALQALPQTGAEPFSAERIGFVHRLSQHILTDAGARDFPELMAMAHWFRKAHVLHLQARFNEAQGGRQGLGTVFHIAPANVDTLFMYSWLLSLLLGNANIVRLTQNRGEQMERLLAYIRSVLAEFPALAQSNLLLSTPHDDALTERLSRFCRLRVVWGGDATVEHIGAIPLPEGAAQIGFCDRFSLAALEAQTVTDAGQEAFPQLLANLYNDALWFDQRACASPRLLAWVGSAATIAAARARFWPAFSMVIRQKGLPACASETLSRATVLMDWAAEGWLAEPAKLEAFPAHALLHAFPPALRESHPGTGLFAEIALPSITDLAALLTEKDQTLVVFGMSEAVLAPFRAREGMRVVTPGQALHFDTRWDGVDFFAAFTA